MYFYSLLTCNKVNVTPVIDKVSLAVLIETTGLFLYIYIYIYV